MAGIDSAASAMSCMVWMVHMGCRTHVLVVAGPTAAVHAMCRGLC
jgi:hypothetical protein